MVADAGSREAAGIRQPGRAHGQRRTRCVARARGRQPATGRRARAGTGRPARRADLPQAHRQRSRPAADATHVQCRRASPRGTRGTAASRGLRTDATRRPLARASASGRTPARSGPAGDLDARAHGPQRLGARDDPAAGLRRGGGGLELRGRWTGCAPRRSRARAASIRPQANVPGDWAGLPAYRLGPGDEITVVERSRGPGAEDRNQIAVERNLWWDFAGTGYTFQDLVSGRMQQDWRLSMAEPYQLQGARKNGQPLLVTRGEDGRAGVEVRTPDLGIEATGRVEGRRGALSGLGLDDAACKSRDHAAPAAGTSAARGARCRQFAVRLARPLAAARHLRRAAGRRRGLPCRRCARGRPLACGVHANASRAARAYLGGAQSADRDRPRGRHARRPGAQMACTLARGRAWRSWS